MSELDTSDRALWFTWYDLPDAGCDEHLAWLHGDYMPKVLARQGVLWAAHYASEANVVPQGGGAGRVGHHVSGIPDGDRYILIFGAREAHVFVNPVPCAFHAALRASDRAMLAMRSGERTNIMVEEARVHGPACDGPLPAPCIQLSSFCADSWENENLIAKWFAQCRLPSVERLPGCVRARKLVSVAGWAKHAALYEFDSLKSRNDHFAFSSAQSRRWRRGRCAQSSTSCTRRNRRTSPAASGRRRRQSCDNCDAPPFQTPLFPTMPRIAALYRYPVKGGTPQACESLSVLAEGRIAGDRALGFRFAGSGLPDTAWSKKYGYAVLVNTPALAKLDMRFDTATRRLRIASGDEVLADESIDDEGRQRLAAAVERYVLAQPGNPLAGQPQRLPLELIGDGVTPRYHDSEQGEITLHSRESLAAVAQAAGDANLSELRFRSNIAIEGIDAWGELAWIGRRIRIGAVKFDVVRHKVRCLATDANPATGVCDIKVMQTIKRAFSQPASTFAVALVTNGAGGVVRVGDDAKLIN